MNTKNLEFLEDSLKYLGFDDKLNLQVARNMQAEEAAFTVNTQAMHFKDRLEATLHFKKSDSADMYFFNKYEASLTKEDGSTKQQTFYIKKSSGITFKEAYNLLDGRAVHKNLQTKEGEKYSAWVQLNFEQKDKYDNNQMKQFTANYGYDLAAVLGKHSIVELNTQEQKDKLLKSLEKGNVQSVSFMKDGKEEKMFIEANPQYKTVNIYDSQMKRVFQENIAKEATQNESLSPITKATISQELGAAQSERTPKKNSISLKNKEMENASLLPKKVQNKKKGVGISK